MIEESYGPFRVVPQLTGRRIAARRDEPAVEKNSVLYLIELDTRGFFTYGYTHEEAAQLVRCRLEQDGVAIDFNLVRDVDDCLPCSRTAEELQ